MNAYAVMIVGFSVLAFLLGFFLGAAMNAPMMGDENDDSPDEYDRPEDYGV